MPETLRTATIRELVPLLFVQEIQKSLAFYQDKCRFSMTAEWAHDGKLAWCRLERDGAAIMLQQACDEDGPAAGRGRGIGFYFNCDDANAIHGELRANGLDVAAPELAFYGMNQLYVADPDGYELCFQSSQDKPIATDATRR